MSCLHMTLEGRSGPSSERVQRGIDVAMIDGDQNLMGNGHGSSFVAAPSFETVKLISKVRALGFGSSIGGFHEL
jgi:hypothetical protein